MKKPVGGIGHRIMLNNANNVKENQSLNLHKEKK